MSLRGRLSAARSGVAATASLAVSGAALAAVPAALTADLLGETSRAGLRAARGVMHAAAVSGVRSAGALLTGADPLPSGHLRDLGDVVRGTPGRPDRDAITVFKSVGLALEDLAVARAALG